MFRKIKWIVQLLLLQLTAKSQSLPFEQLPYVNPLQTEFDSILHEQVKNFFKKSKAPGLIIGISKNGERQYYSYGFADTSDKREFSSATIFEAGSITKTFTANLLFQFEANGLLQSNDPAVKYLPENLTVDSALKKISLADLATHSSGLQRIPSNLDKIKEYAPMQPYKYYKKEHLYAYLENVKNLKPGKYAYSNLGFGLLSTVLENKAGKDFESLLNEYLWRPLGMNSSYINIKTSHADTATGYFYGKPAEYWQFDCLAGCGAVKTNATDMLIYLETHISPSNNKLSVAVKKTTVPVMMAGPGMQICYGWHTLDDLKHRVYWHNGGTFSFSAFAGFEPVTKTAIILASNAFNVNAALDKLATDLLILLTKD